MVSGGVRGQHGGPWRTWYRSERVAATAATTRWCCGAFALYAPSGVYSNRNVSALRSRLESNGDASLEADLVEARAVNSRASDVDAVKVQTGACVPVGRVESFAGKHGGGATQKRCNGRHDAIAAADY